MSRPNSRCKLLGSLVVKGQGHISKVSKQDPAADLSSPDSCSFRELRRCLDSLPIACLPASTARTRCLLFLAGRPPHSRYRRKLCCSSGRHIQFGTWHSLEITASTHNIHHIPKGTARDKRWCHGIRAGGRSFGVPNNCHHIDGADSILSTEIPDDGSARHPRLDIDTEKPMHIRDGVMGSTRKCSGQLVRRLVTTERGRYQNWPNR